jgi:hypothetical protein
MIVSTRLTIGTTAQRVVPASSNPIKVKLLNAGTEVVRIGGDASVSKTLAFGLNRLPNNPEVARNVYEFTLNPGEEIWAVVNANTADLNVWYQGTD